MNNMDNAHLDRLREAVAAVRMRSPLACSWFDVPAPRLPSHLRKQLTAEQLREQALFTLKAQLYRNFYCPGSVTQAADPDAGGRPGPMAFAFVDELSAANAGLDGWEGGWQVRDLRDGEVLASRDDVTVSARPRDCRPQPVPGPGGTVALRLPKESHFRAPGFYLAYSDAEFEGREADGLLRLYWNLEPAGAVRLMRHVTTLLNGAGIGFSLKVLSDPAAYFLRCDAGVLYLRRQDWSKARNMLQRIHRAVASGLRAGTPVFTKPLGRGLACAEDPANGESFGMHRCRLVAEGLVRAHEARIRSVEPRLRMVVERFTEDGVDIARPYLNPGSEDGYDLGKPPVTAITRRPQTAAVQTTPLDRTTGVHPEAAAQFLGAAEAIGARLCQEAVWHAGRCSWMGEEPTRLGQVTPAASSGIGPDLYSGTAGITLFLAQVGVHTREASVRRAALGAARHALRHAEHTAVQGSLGLYTGVPGIALAAARTGRLLDDQELVDRSVGLAYGMLDQRPQAPEFDLLSGLAGTIVAVLAIAALVDEDRELTHAAEALGDQLLRIARREDHLMCWSSPALPDQPPLTGLSHGAAGAALALLELYAATGGQRWKQAASSAFAYERRWFEPERANWRDLRDLPGNGPFMTAWCHGAPGIALVRLRAFELLGDERLREEATNGLATTMGAVDETLRRGVEDFSLCHGLTGLAEVLLEAGRRGTLPEGQQIAAAVGRTGMELYATTGRPWACGTRTGEAPGLMMGLSGIGHFYLRLADPQIPSILLPWPIELAGRAPSTWSTPIQAIPDARPAITASGASQVTATHAGALDNPELEAVIRLSLRAGGYTVAPEELAAARTERWEVGVIMRNRMLPAKLPGFADALDLLALPETDPNLWHSLPHMLAFGREQALTLAPLARVPATERDRVAEVCSVFSALLSLFDYLVDEAGQTATVFAVEPEAVAGLFRADGEDRMAEAHDRASDARVRLLLGMFAMLGRGLRDLYGRSGNTPAWQALEDQLRRLFAAERTSTLERPRTLAQLQALSESSRGKSILPFVTLLRILVLAGPDPDPSPTALTATVAIGQAVCAADDIVDLLTDLRRMAPSPLVVRVTELAALRESDTVGDQDLLQLVESATRELIELLEPSAFGAIPETDAVVDVVAFARRTVARWVGWSERADDLGAAPPTLGQAVAEPARRLVERLRDRRPDRFGTRVVVLNALAAARAAGLEVSANELEGEALRLLRDLLHSPDIDSGSAQLLERALTLLGSQPLAALCRRTSQAARPAQSHDEWLAGALVTALAPGDARRHPALRALHGGQPATPANGPVPIPDAMEEAMAALLRAALTVLTAAPARDEDAEAAVAHGVRRLVTHPADEQPVETATIAVCLLAFLYGGGPPLRPHKGGPARDARRRSKPERLMAGRR